jgi:flotillin
VEVVIVVSMVMLSGVAVIVIQASRYKKVPPDKAMVVFGRRMPNGKGYVVLSGGGRFIMPIIESYELLDLSAKVCDLELKGVKAGGPDQQQRVSISTSTTYKVSSDPALLDAAVEHLLHVPDGELRRMVQGVMEGAIRGMCAELTTDQIEHDRDEVALRVRQRASTDLNNLGIEIRAFSIKDAERKA